MKILLFLLSFILVYGFFINHAYALKTYNASKSNTASTSIAKDEIDKSIDEAKSEALEIVDQMLNQLNKRDKSKNRSSDDKIKVTPLDTTMESLAGSSIDDVTYKIKVIVTIEDE